MVRLLLTTLFLALTLSVAAQFGGEHTYDFLNLSSQARANALGGNVIGLVDSAEAAFACYNPAALRSSMHGSINVSYVSYFKDIKIGDALYVHDFDKKGTFAAAMHYIDYGKFIEAQEDGEIIGSFRAADYAFNIIWSKELWKRIVVGANLKPVYSSYEEYKSFGIAADLGVSYTDSTGLFSAGLAVKNIGSQITTYYQNGDREPLPFDLQLGVSQKFAHAPFRLNLTMQNLLQWNLTDKSTWDYDNNDSDEYVSGNSDNFIRQLMRHAIIGVEFVPSSNFSISFGYNYQRRRELGIESNPAAVGLSGGFNVKISKFRLSYAIASYHLAGTSNTFSITTKLSEFYK